jgi:hypothetical protein
MFIRKMEISRDKKHCSKHYLDGVPYNDSAGYDTGAGGNILRLIKRLPVSDPARCRKVLQASEHRISLLGALPPAACIGRHRWLWSSTGQHEQHRPLRNSAQAASGGHQRHAADRLPIWMEQTGAVGKGSLPSYYSGVNRQTRRS